MNDSAQSSLPPRVIGDVGAASEGPTLLVLGGLHGNEPAGVRALERVFDHLRSRPLPMAGRLVGLRGNQAALAVGERFLDDDLNRRWFQEDPILIQRDASALGRPPRAEDAQRAELLAEVQRLETDATGPLQILDLHSTSGASPPFTVLPDAPRNYPLAFALGVSIIFGLDEVTDGTFLGYLNDRGHQGVAMEGGQHDDPLTEELHVAAIWIALVTTGVIQERHVRELPRHRRRLQAAAAGRPEAVEIIHRHPISPGDEFRMEPGFESFQRVRRGELLARDKAGGIRAAGDARILMPLYQGQGEDGFFLARDLGSVRLRLATALRALGAQRALSLVPGIRRHADGERLLVSPHLARGATRELLSLLGYRRWRYVGGHQVEFSRRRQK